MEDFDTLLKLMPTSIKEAIYRNAEAKLAELATGLDTSNIDLEKVAAYLGARCASRRAKWASICNGILALDRMGE